MPDRNSFLNTDNSADRRGIRRVFKRFYGSSQWASRETGVTPGTVSKWLRGEKVSHALDSMMPGLAQRLIETKGFCIGRSSARAKVNKLRRKGSR